MSVQRKENINLYWQLEIKHCKVIHNFLILFVSLPHTFYIFYCDISLYNEKILIINCITFAGRNVIFTYWNLDVRRIERKMVKKVSSY
jgi:hypothetical protein